MKKTFIILLLALFAGAALFSQNLRFETIYDKYKHEPDVVNVYVPGILMKLAARIDRNLSLEEEDLLRSIRSIKVLAVENDQINDEVNFVDEFKTMSLHRNYVHLMESHNKDTDVLILARMKEDLMRDMMIVVGGEENVLVRIKGRIDTDLMHALKGVTGIEHMGYAQGISLQ